MTVDELYTIIKTHEIYGCSYNNVVMTVRGRNDIFDTNGEFFIAHRKKLLIPSEFVELYEEKASISSIYENIDVMKKFTIIAIKSKNELSFVPIDYICSLSFTLK